MPRPATNIGPAGAEREYRSGIRSAAYALWSGAWTYDDFWDGMMTVIDFGLTRAWNAGAAECGVQPSEFTEAEKRALATALVTERQYIHGFATFIQEHRKGVGLRREVYRRAELWARRARDVINRARTMTCGDKKLVWQYGATEEHCRSCKRLVGKVKRASQWRASGIRPQSPQLECGGFL